MTSSGKVVDWNGITAPTPSLGKLLAYGAFDLYKAVEEFVRSRPADTDAAIGEGSPGSPANERQWRFHPDYVRVAGAGNGTYDAHAAAVPAAEVTAVEPNVQTGGDVRRKLELHMQVNPGDPVERAFRATACALSPCGQVLLVAACAVPVLSTRMASPDSMPQFIPSKSFTGSKASYCFKLGDLGLGYYFDHLAVPKPMLEVPPGNKSSAMLRLAVKTGQMYVFSVPRTDKLSRPVVTIIREYRRQTSTNVATSPRHVTSTSRKPTHIYPSWFSLLTSYTMLI